MKVIDVVETCNKILDLDIEVGKISSGEVLPCDKTSRIVSCCNLVLEELYRDYAAHCRKTVAEARDGFISTSEYNLCRVLSLCDGEGSPVSFRYTEGGVLVKKDGKYNMTYAKLPVEVGINDNITLPSPKITDRIFIYGVLREYLLQNGDYTAAQVWREKFEDALSVANMQTVSGVMPVRRWL